MKRRENGSYFQKHIIYTNINNMLVTANRASAIVYNILKSLDSPKKFLLPSNICPIVPITFLKAGVEYEFVDISSDDYCLDLEAVSKKIKNKYDYTGLFYVRTYGYMQDMTQPFSKLKHENEEFLIIDDRCLSRPELSPDMQNSDVVIFSTGEKKYLDIGGGGYGYIAKTITYKIHKENYLQEDHDDLEDLYNKNFTEVIKQKKYESNWLNLDKLNKSDEEYFAEIKSGLSKINLHKQDLNKYYKENIPTNMQLLEPFQDWRFNILSKNKNMLMRSIFNEGLFASSHYKPLEKGHLVAEKLYNNVINLFNDHNFTIKQAEAISKLISNNKYDEYTFQQTSNNRQRD